MNESHWKTALKNQIQPELKNLIDDYELTLKLKKENKVEDKVFGETRLRMGAYGQRYDNGFRHDGQELQSLRLPSEGKTKGVETVWDAPGMQRIKIPYGGMTLSQLETLADLAEEYSDEILHITTRQDVQLHFVHLEDTPDLFRRLAAVGITTQEACGNSIRNITGCPFMGVCADEPFDVTPHAHKTFAYLLGHPDCQDFGRKFKISFSGCHQHACGQAQMHDVGFIAKMQDGIEGFKVVVGGGLGAVPMQAKTFYEFLPATDIQKFLVAVSRVFGRFGEKKNRNRARIKFLIGDWGLEKFKEVVDQELQTMTFDATIKQDWPFQKDESTTLKTDSKSLNALQQDPDYQNWLKQNVKEQKQKGFHTVVISLPLGDITSQQARKLARLLPRYIGQNTLRTTVEQDLLLRWIHSNDLPELFHGLKQINLHQAEYNTINSMVACPGTDTCKLGISASRGLAGELRSQLQNKTLNLPESAKALKINMSGCWNSCGQHHIADIGFYGIGRKVGNYLVPHFQLVLGGDRQHNTQSYGLAVMAIPSKNIPEAVSTLTHFFDQNKTANETFQNFVERMGKAKIKEALNHLTTVPDYNIDASYYTDWGDVRVYSKKDIGIGECAGEVVSTGDFAVAKAERLVFDAQLALDEKRFSDAEKLIFESMRHAAEGLVREFIFDLKPDFQSVRQAFQEKLVNTKLFWDPFSADRFARYFTGATEPTNSVAKEETIKINLEQAQLFIEACHSYLVKRNMESTPSVGQIS